MIVGSKLIIDEESLRSVVIFVEVDGVEIVTGSTEDVRISLMSTSSWKRSTISLKKLNVVVLSLEATVFCLCGTTVVNKSISV